MDEELSTVAHKLRDLLDPDALFLLVTTRGGVQLIADRLATRLTSPGLPSISVEVGMSAPLPA